MTEKFSIAIDCVDSNKVPKKKLASGAGMPVVGLGTSKRRFGFLLSPPDNNLRGRTRGN